MFADRVHAPNPDTVGGDRGARASGADGRILARLFNILSILARNTKIKYIFYMYVLKAVWNTPCLIT